jgi:Xaa-Pro aminopeptidase
MRESAAPTLPQRLAPLLAADYPAFSEAEMQRRRTALAAVMARAGVDHVVYCGANRAGSAVQWLSQWPVTAEAVGVHTPGRRDALYIHHYNHLPLARRIADADVSWAGASATAKAVDELARRGGAHDRVGVIGPMTFENHALLAARFGTVVSLNKDYVRLRRVKSAEEIDWFRIGAYLSDLGMAAMREAARPGLTERELGDAIERAYVPLGGTTSIHYIGLTAMADPRVGVPRQFPSGRRVETGDVLFAEISANFWDHSGQILRTFTVGTDPNVLYGDLYDTAEAAFAAMTSVLKAGTTPEQIVAASHLIEDRGFTTIDDILHGYGGGYFPPILASSSRAANAIPPESFEAGQIVVVQPNVVTQDGTAGVQVGEMLLVTDTGIERFHTLPRAFTRIG